MDSRERAEKLSDIIVNQFLHNMIRPQDISKMIFDDLVKAKREGMEEAATMIEDWHIPAKGGTHSMAFAIRARAQEVK